VRVPLRVKILGAQAANLLLVLVVWFGAYYLLAHLGRSAESILSENYRSIEAANGMRLALARQEVSQLALLRVYSEAPVREFVTAQNEFARWLGIEKDNITIAGEADAVADVESLYSEYLVEHTRLLAALQFDALAAPSLHARRVEPLRGAIDSALVVLVELNRSRMYDASQRTRRTARESMAATVLVGILALTGGILLSAWLSKRISAPVRSLTALAHEVAEGNLDAYIKPGGRDEIGQLAAEFDRMVKRLREYRDMDISRIVAERTRADAILSSIDDGVVTFDSEFRVTSANSAAGRVLGEAPAVLVGRHCLEATRDERLFEGLKQTFEAGQWDGADRAELAVEREGRTRYYHYSFTPMRTADGKSLGVVLLLQDISKFRELDRLRTEFVMTASHELKTPLTSLVMAVRLLGETTLTPRQHELVTMADEETQRLKDTVYELLDLSRIESGRIEMHPQPIDLTALLDRAEQSVQQPASSRAIKFERALEPGLPELLVDADKILLVLANLLSNAVRYSPEGGRIRFEARRLRDRVFVSVVDQGPGVPPEAQSRVFEPFFRVGGPEQQGGTGLGLAIAREIVRAHRGAIWVESEPGQGSRFTFSLPAAVAPQQGKEHTNA
jgi:NtrC-family two-component system sensor histidine kinase KinB